MTKQSVQTSYGGFVRGLALSAAGLILACALVSFAFDPFYHYHSPWFSLRPVLTDKEYQVPGTLRNFSYTSVLAGSSVVENNDNRWFEERFGGTFVKAVRSYGTIPDLIWYLDLAFAGHDLEYVFFNLDPAALTGNGELTFEETGCPMYLYDRNPFNDVSYLLNKTVLLEKIPYGIAQSHSASFEPSKSYNWAAGKDFSEAGALSQYWRSRECHEPKPADFYRENTEKTLALLTRMVGSHPETNFVFFFPPYSMLWWDDTHRNGDTAAYLDSEELVMRSLLAYDNVTVYSFQNEEWIVSDLSRYMDTLHFDPGINEWMVQAMAEGKNRVEPEDIGRLMEETWSMQERLLQGPIEDLASAGAFQ